MTRILVLTEEYKKISLPNSVCLKYIVDYLRRQGIDVDIISAEKEVYKNTKTEYYFVEKKNNKIIYKINKLLNYPISARGKVQRYVEYVEKLLNKQRYSAIIAVQNPNETVAALKKIKEKHADETVILYEIDPASNRYKFPKGIIQKYLMKKAKKWEIKAYRRMDYIIHMKSHMNHYRNKTYKEFEDKTRYLDIPAFRGDSSLEVNATDKKISLIYAGAFYKKLRDPDKMLKILFALTKKLPIEVKMFINAPMVEYVANKCKGKKEFDISGYISEEKLKIIIKESSCLISLGNKESDFLPSKVLTYMGMEKPIIHFYYDDYDVSLLYLKKYRNAICVNLNDSVDNIVSDIQYYLKYDLNKNRLNSKELLECFKENTPEFTARKIIEILTSET